MKAKAMRKRLRHVLVTQSEMADEMTKRFDQISRKLGPAPTIHNFMVGFSRPDLMGETIFDKLEAIQKMLKHHTEQHESRMLDSLRELRAQLFQADGQGAIAKLHKAAAEISGINNGVSKVRADVTTLLGRQERVADRDADHWAKLRSGLTATHENGQQTLAAIGTMERKREIDYQTISKLIGLVEARLTTIESRLDLQDGDKSDPSS